MESVRKEKALGASGIPATAGPDLSGGINGTVLAAGPDMAAGEKEDPFGERRADFKRRIESLGLVPDTFKQKVVAALINHVDPTEAIFGKDLAGEVYTDGRDAEDARGALGSTIAFLSRDLKRVSLRIGRVYARDRRDKRVKYYLTELDPGADAVFDDSFEAVVAGDRPGEEADLRGVDGASVPSDLSGDKKPKGKGGKRLDSPFNRGGKRSGSAFNHSERDSGDLATGTGEADASVESESDEAAAGKADNRHGGMWRNVEPYCPDGRPHHWKIAEPNGSVSPGECKHCGRESWFPNSNSYYTSADVRSERTAGRETGDSLSRIGRN